MAFQWRNNKDLCTLSAHSKCHELHGESLAGTAGAENSHVGILIDTAVKDIDNDQTVVMLVDTEQNTVLIR